MLCRYDDDDDDTAVERRRRATIDAKFKTRAPPVDGFSFNDGGCGDNCDGGRGCRLRRLVATGASSPNGTAAWVVAVTGTVSSTSSTSSSATFACALLPKEQLPAAIALAAVAGIKKNDDNEDQLLRMKPFSNSLFVVDGTTSTAAAAAVADDDSASDAWSAAG
jgi:hypothetical protein